MDRGKRAEFRPGKVGSHSPAAAGERWTSERPSSDQGALFKAATSKLRAGVRRRRGMAELRKGLLEEEAPRLPACPPSPGRVLMGGGVLTGACPHQGVSSPGRVLTGACPHGGMSSRGHVLTEDVSSPCLRSPGRGTLALRDGSLLLASLPACFLFSFFSVLSRKVSIRLWAAPCQGHPRYRGPLCPTALCRPCKSQSFSKLIVAERVVLISKIPNCGKIHSLGLLWLL